MKQPPILLAYLSLLMITAGSAFAAVGAVYVTTNGTGNGTGWGDPTSLANALVVCDPGEEIWIVQGTYTNDWDGTNSFLVSTNNIKVYGGFTNGMASSSDRNSTNYPVILDGLAARRVIEVSGTNVTIDGLVMTNGYFASTTSGGVGLYKSGAGPLTLVNSRIVGNKGGKRGTGCYFADGSVTMTNCTFAYNLPYTYGCWGYGFYAAGLNVIVSNCLFHRNWYGAIGTWNARNTKGGAIHFDDGILRLSGCTFTSNALPGHTSAGYGGGGAYITGTSTALVMNCVFQGNQVVADGSLTTAEGGALHVAVDSARTVTVENCTMAGNYADELGGALYVASGNLVVKNSILWSNTADDGTGDEVYGAAGASGAISYSCLSGTGTDDVFGDVSQSNVITNDPHFATNSFADLHLKSYSGRWDPSLAGWTNDPGVLSPCMDVGDPTSDYSQEPAGATGMRINQGAYGNTAQASKSPAIAAPVVTNVAAQTNYNVATLEGQLISGTISEITIYWGTNSSNLEHSETIYPPQSTGVVFSISKGLLPDKQYYYSCYATNSAGADWALTNAFTTGPAPPGGGATVIHVDKDATQTQDGTSWYTAYQTIGAGVAAAQGITNEMWVAEGTYAQGAELSIATNLAIYGGFTGTETNRSDRSPTNIVIVNGQATYRILNISGTNVVLDGLVITNGYFADGSDGGAGIRKSSAGPLTMSGCKIVGNKGGKRGTGCYFGDGPVTLTNCTFANNVPYEYSCNGYGLYASGTDMVIMDCVFTRNWHGAIGGWGARATRGGAIYFEHGILTVSDSAFTSNTAAGHTSASFGGGAAYITGTSTALVKNCVFLGNQAATDGPGTTAEGGGLYVNVDSARTVTVENCTFARSQAYSDGGAFYVNSGNLVVKNSILWTNIAGAGTGDEIYNDPPAVVSISYSCLSGTGGDDLFGTISQSNIITNDPLFVSTTDLHLRSQYGRWDPAITAWTNDTGVWSACIDAGDPASSYAEEPANSGDYINLGAYGNTVEASKSPVIISPVVTNSGVETNYTLMTLKGVLVSGAVAELTIYYGTNATGLGTQSSAAIYPPQYTGTVFSMQLELLPSQVYYYACFATNSAGTNWAGTTSFTSGAEPIGGGAGIIHVDKDATGAENGNNWLNAYQAVADAAQAAAGTTNEIWIAEGTYLEGAELSITSNVALYGGFTGTETNRSERSLTNQVILDGNAAYRVIHVTGTNVTLDGLVISNGYFANASDGGAGIRKSDVGPLTMIDCKIICNKGGKWGTGSYFADGSVTLTNCTFANNLPHEYTCSGYGLYASGTDMLIMDCVFTRNWHGAIGGWGARASRGGAIYFKHGLLTVSGCTFTSNTAAGHSSAGYGGGAAYITGTTTALVKNCAFQGNQAVTEAPGITAEGGVLYVNVDGARTVTVENCTMAGNYADELGGALHLVSGHLVVKNSILWTNTSDALGDEMYVTNGTATISYSDITGTNAMYVENGGGASVTWGDGIIAADPLFASLTDVHLKSPFGRWVAPNTWVTDDDLSPCIDAGDPASAYSKELLEHGSVINLGAYGNTVQASKSPQAGGSVFIVR